MIAKLIAILTSRDTQEQILSRIRDNPKTSWTAMLCFGIFGAAAGLYQSGYILAGGLVGGAGWAVACVALLFAADGGPKPPAPPAAPSAP